MDECQEQKEVAASSSGESGRWAPRFGSQQNLSRMSTLPISFLALVVGREK